MVVVQAIQKWCHYLLRHKFIVRTDQCNLKFLLDQRMVSLNHQKWLCKLLGYDFDIKYKPSFANEAVDAFSRLPAHATLLSISIPQVVQLEEVDKQVVLDPYLSQIRTALAHEQPAISGYFLAQGRLYYHNKLVLCQPIPI